VNYNYLLPIVFTNRMHESIPETTRRRSINKPLFRYEINNKVVILVSPSDSMRFDLCTMYFLDLKPSDKAAMV
jgi:hypothetical protein